MSDEPKPGTLYRRLLQPVWERVSIYDGPAAFKKGFKAIQPELGHLYAAHWCQSEVRNGGLHQFFTNPTGVLAPEALEAFRAMELSGWASVLDEAMHFFGDRYPRQQLDRVERLDQVQGSTRQQWDPFYKLDDQFYAWLTQDQLRWDRVADDYARRTGG